MLRFIIFICVFSFIVPLSFGGDGKVNKHIRKAQRYRNTNKFEKAEFEYKSALELDPQSFRAQFELGLLYDAAFFDKSKAFEAFKKSEVLMPKDTIYEVYLQLAKSNHYFENYSEAIHYYELFRNGIEAKGEGLLLGSNNDRALAQSKFAMEYKTRVFDGQIKNLGENVNSPFSEYIPVFIERDSSLLFTRRGTDNLGDYYWDNQFYEDMFISSLGDDEFKASQAFNQAGSSLNELENTRKHESVVAVNSSEDTLIVYKENTLWYSVWSGSEWNEPVKYSESINISKYQRHGCLSTDGKTMIFSSDSDKGKGGYDLFISNKKEDGTWGEAVGLSDLINTDKNEDSPFLTRDGKRLYFSSTGHDGMGGYDLFYSEKVGGAWSVPINLGYPMNSPADDIYLKIADGGRKMYLSSNRMNGLGSMDIYTFVPYGLPQFKSCDTLVNPTYTVSIDANESTDDIGIPLIYQWDLGDGTIKYGKKLEHVYKRPGSYFIKLNAIDSLTGRFIYDEELITVVSDVPVVLGENNRHIEPYGADTVMLGSKGYYNATISQVPGDSITNYFWNVENQISEADSIELNFDELGEKELQLEVLSRNLAGEEQRFCVSKKVFVISEDEMNELLAANNSSLDNLINGSESGIDIGSNLNDSSIGPLPVGVDFKLINIYFDFDKFNLRNDAVEAMEKNIAVLNGHKNVVIKVVGHTDAFGSDSYNERLSKKRAKAAVKYLKDQGISIDRIKATLYEGEVNPAVPNKNPDGSDNPVNRQKNRRVEFYVVGVLK